MIARAAPDDAPALAALMLASRRAAMPWLRELHDQADATEFLAARVLPCADVLVATDDGRPAGFIAVQGEEVAQLYVRPDARGRGVGGALLERAKALRPEGLELWCFQRNHEALRFYAAHGFAELYRTDGAANEEREPDVRLGWPVITDPVLRQRLRFTQPAAAGS